MTFMTPATPWEKELSKEESKKTPAQKSSQAATAGHARGQSAAMNKK